MAKYKYKTHQKKAQAVWLLLITSLTHLDRTLAQKCKCIDRSILSGMTMQIHPQAELFEDRLVLLPITTFARNQKPEKLPTSPAALIYKSIVIHFQSPAEM